MLLNILDYSDTDVGAPIKNLKLIINIIVIEEALPWKILREGMHEILLCDNLKTTFKMFGSKSGRINLSTDVTRPVLNVMNPYRWPSIRYVYWLEWPKWIRLDAHKILIMLSVAATESITQILLMLITNRRRHQHKTFVACSKLVTVWWILWIFS